MIAAVIAYLLLACASVVAVGYVALRQNLREFRQTTTDIPVPSSRLGKDPPGQISGDDVAVILSRIDSLTQEVHQLNTLVAAGRNQAV